MTLATSTNRIAYQGNGSTTAYPIPFRFFANADIRLYFNDTLCSTGFTITGAGVEAGGTLTFISPPPDDTDLVITRVLTLTQSVDLGDHDALPATALEQNGLDRVVMLIQQVDDKVNRAPLLSEFSCTTGITLPEPEDGKILIWSSGVLVNTTNGEQGPQGEQGIQGPSGAGASPDVTDCSTTVSVPSQLWFDSASGFGVSEPGSGVAKVTLTIAGVPTGTVIGYIAASEPTGWKLCNGQALSRTTFAALFAVIDVTFGVGDGSTTFNVPDLRGRVGIGAGTGAGLTARTLAATGGCETHTLVTSEMPAHTHTIAYSAQAVANTGGNQPLTAGGTVETSSTGGGGAHNNMPPFLVLHYLIKT